MFQRQRFLEAIQSQFNIHEVCALIGPRQCGKTTLAQEYAKQNAGVVTFFDLENPEALMALQNPLRILENLTGLVVIDEIQRLPDLFPVLRVLADRKQARYLILGSASRDLIRQSSESLAGRIGYIELTPFQIAEGGDESKLLTRGGFPDSYLAVSDRDSYNWRKSYIRTYLERDIPALGFNVPPLTLQRFWMMLAHYHGQLLNMNQIGTAMGISGHTVRHYLEILTGTFMVRLLPPWFENTEKRQTKSPKLYIRDSGLFMNLVRIEDADQLVTSPLRGAIWEGFALEQIIAALEMEMNEVFFWRTINGAEIDLMIFKGNKRYGFEFKFGDAPSTTRSMRIALNDLRLEHLYVIYPGQQNIILDDQITAVPLSQMLKDQNLFPATK
ncbi:MAG: ATP-binding protein [Candidatus Paracaedibacteraceae bacterium]|nr:ATP-binding protein [Candidatus Paracaedibacteraceae bacterium]